MTWDIDGEREPMFFAALEKLRTGALVCVFDATDRIQHMFWRYLEPGHPADVHGGDDEHRRAIETLYERNDALVGRVMARDGPARRADGALRPRVHVVPPRRQPQRLAAARTATSP